MNRNHRQVIKKRAWTLDEDQKVIQLVEQLGPHKWTYIAAQLQGRIGKQCRERWHNHLNPMIKKTPWEDYEEWLLFLYHRAISNKWAQISKHIEGRTDNSIKNHWNSGMKKRIPEFNQKLNQLKLRYAKEGPSFTDEFDKIEAKALEIILMNKKYQNIASEDESGNDTNSPNKRIHPKYQQQQIEVAQSIQSLQDLSDQIQFSDSNFYFQTPAAFQRKKIRGLEGSAKLYSDHDEIRQNLFI